MARRSAHIGVHTLTELQFGVERMAAALRLVEGDTLRLWRVGDELRMAVERGQAKARPI